MYLGAASRIFREEERRRSLSNRRRECFNREVDFLGSGACRIPVDDWQEDRR